ncbi:unnamed protein product, partial [Rotaria sp. Silwood1]
NFFTLFENFPNELFIEILSYLIATDAVIAFSNLNHCFQCLIFEFCQSFDFTSINKNKFDIIFQGHNTNRWHSLKLSDDNNTPGQSLTHLSQLINLEIYQKEREISFPNGQIWEQIILSSLPLLKSFKFYFQFAYYYHQFDQIKQVIATFSTPFYVLEKNWFIRCDMSTRNDTHDMYNRHRKFAVLYTIPFPFETLIIFKISPKTTILNLSKNNIDHLRTNLYANIKILVIKSYTKRDQNFNRSLQMNANLNKELTPSTSLNAYASAVPQAGSSHGIQVMTHEGIRVNTQLTPSVDVYAGIHATQTTNFNFTKDPVISHQQVQRGIQVGLQKQLSENSNFGLSTSLTQTPHSSQMEKGVEFHYNKRF